METKDWRQECERLHAELDIIKLEASEWKEKWERLMQFKDAPRLPARGLNDSTNTKYTTVGWDNHEDWR